MQSDTIDRRLLALLQRDGRLAYQALGDAVGLSPAAAYQRVRKLEAAGAILGYHARLDPAAVGRPVVAYLHVAPAPGAGADPGRLVRTWRAAPEVVECQRLTGPAGYLLRLRLGAPADLVGHVEAARAAGCVARAELALRTEFERWELPVD